MKLHFLVLSFLTALLLAACNFTLAEDVTPPPNYIPPTPAPTMGPLFPAQAPSTQNGALIFGDKCAACHGPTGLGDGEQGIQLNVTVPAFGLPEVARPASLAQWYTVVTRGNIERFMPPFASLSDQQRWDVVAYAMTLHMDEQDLARGQELFESSCDNCSTQFFSDQAQMAALSEVELARIIKEGNDQVPPFGAGLSDEDVWAVAAYLRTLSFDTESIAAAEASTATAEPADMTPETPAAEGAPLGTAQAAATDATAQVEGGLGTVSGSVDNQTGEPLPAGLKVTLRGFDHGSDPSAGPQEVYTQEAQVDADGSYVFEDVQVPLNRIFIAELTYDDIELRSDFAIVKEGETRLTLPPIALYGKTEDTSALVFDDMRIFLEYGTDAVQVFNVYSFRNPGDQIIVVKLDEKGEIPFLKAPAGSSGFGYETMQDSETMLQLENGFAIPPSENAYGMLTFATLPKEKEFEFAQEFVLPASTVTIFVPEGVTVETGQSTNLGVQAIQDFNFQIYELGSVDAGETLTLQVAGTPREPGAATTPEGSGVNRNLLIGAGVAGIALILAGAWMYLRDRNHAEEESGEDGEDEFESADEVLDAIVALDDLHRAKKISDAAYQNRRAELKEILKEKM